jgi:hypothetical protein
MDDRAGADVMRLLRVATQLRDTDGLQYSPRRMKNFRDAWRSLHEYVASCYVEEATVEGRIIYRRRESRSDLASVPLH